MKCLTLLLSMALLVQQANAQVNTDSSVAALKQLMLELPPGTAESDFLAKYGAKVVEVDTLMGFRKSYIIHQGANGIESLEIYCTTGADPRLYELIITCEGPKARKAMQEAWLGRPNYPDKEEHWVLKKSDPVIWLAWAFSNKLVVAANLPGSEWEGDSMFKLPEGFRL